jgi:hypothetical protein
VCVSARLLNNNRSAELRSWLLQHEALLFKCRFRQLTSTQQVRGAELDGQHSRRQQHTWHTLRPAATHADHNTYIQTSTPITPHTIVKQVDFFSSMELPYHAISEAEAEELCGQLSAVALACGDVAQYRRIEACWGKGAAAAAGGGSRLSDVAGLPDR